MSLNRKRDTLVGFGERQTCHFSQTHLTLFTEVMIKEILSRASRHQNAFYEVKTLQRKPAATLSETSPRAFT